MQRRVHSFMTRWGLLSLVGVILIAFWLGMYLLTRTQESRALEDSRRELVQLNGAVAQHAAAMFKSMETALHTVDRWLQANPGIDPRSDPNFVGLVNELHRMSGDLLELRVIDASGNLFTVPTLDAKAIANVSDRDYFRAQRSANERELHIGDPIRSRVSRKWVMPVSWRLASPVGEIAVVSAVVDLDRLFVLHERMRLKPAGTITILRRDGIVLLRTPLDDELIGKDLRHSESFRNEIAVNQRGSYITARATTDGVARMISYERLEDYPVSVLVSRGLNEVLVPYFRQREVVMGIGALLTTLTLAFAALLHRSMRRTQLAHDQLHRLATTDSLTGVSNRRAFLENAQREFSRASRFSRPLAVLMLDIDHFKQVNDVRGHAAGDVVLRECARTWHASLREQDLIGRTGGEEFCVVLPETALEGAVQVAERLRTAASMLRFPGREGDFSVTVSIGATCADESDEQFSQAAERADRALYLAKQNGRNRVESMQEMQIVETGSPP